MTQPKEPHPDDLLTINDICREMKISRSTFNRIRASGRLPEPVISTSRTTLRWKRIDLIAALGNKEPPQSLEARLHIASTHACAAAMNARAAAVHADATNHTLRSLAIPITALANKHPADEHPTDDEPTIDEPSQHSPHKSQETQP